MNFFTVLSKSLLKLSLRIFIVFDLGFKKGFTSIILALQLANSSEKSIVVAEYDYPSMMSSFFADRRIVYITSALDLSVLVLSYPGKDTIS